jgi:hypothetical protein
MRERQLWAVVVCHRVKSLGPGCGLSPFVPVKPAVLILCPVPPWPARLQQP